MPETAYTPAFAVVRVDDFLPDGSPLQNRITVKEIVSSLELAEREVERLSRINADKGCHYFATPTKVFRAGLSAGGSSHRDDQE